MSKLVLISEEEFISYLEGASERTVKKLLTQTRKAVVLIPFDQARKELGGIGKDLMYKLEKLKNLTPIKLGSMRLYRDEELAQVKAGKIISKHVKEQ